MEIKQYNRYRDGGTVGIITNVGDFFCDDRIKSKTKGKWYNEYPKGEDNEEVYFTIQLRDELVAALREYSDTQAHAFHLSIPTVIKSLNDLDGLEPNYNSIVWVVGINNDFQYNPNKMQYRVYKDYVNQLHNKQYFLTEEECQDYCDAKPRINYYPKDLRLSERLIEELNDRGGFDDWWGNIGEDNQQEILGNLANVISTFKE